MDKSDEKHLIQTLELAGVSAAARKKSTTLAFSKPEKQENRRIHDTTNELILDLLRIGDLGPCIHVTGEMRALTDPLHRRVCEEMRLRDKGSFDVLYNLPEDARGDATSLVAWNLRRWARGKTRSWDEELRTIDVIASRAVDLFAYDTSQPIQFSVFGRRHILLQEHHHDIGTSKRIWLLESEALNDFFVDHALSCKAKATDVDEGLFYQFASNVSGVAARRYLARLCDATVERESLLDDPFVRNYVSDTIGPLDALLTMGFVNEAHDTGLLTITPAGREFLTAF